MKDYAIGSLAQIEVSARTGIWDAHKGCAAIAGALLLAQQLVKKDAAGAVEAQVKLQLGTDLNPAPSKEVISRTVFIKRILAELKVDARQPKGLGHDVIYSAYVLRALEVFEINPWNSLLESLTKLVRDVKRSGPGWMTVNGKNESRPMSEAADNPYGSHWEAFACFDRPLPMEVGDMQLGHLLTHGHAIEMLERYADKALMVDLHLAYRKRMQSLRLANLEQRDHSPLPLRPVDPRDKKYWLSANEFGHMHGHVLKYAYSFLDLKRGGISEADLCAYGRIVWPDYPIEPPPRLADKTRELN